MKQTATARMIREWVAKDGGDVERTARWMARTLRIGTISECRAMISDATLRPSPGPYGSELAAELTAAAYPELDLAIDRDEVGWHWLRAANA